LHLIAQQRAVAAYTSRETATDTTGALFGSSDVMREIRRKTLLARANARGDAAIAELRVLNEDLGIQKENLQSKREDAARAVSKLDSERAAIAATVADAQRAYDDLVSRLAREAASRAAAERAAQQAVAAAARRTQTVSGTPVSGFLCPVRGAFTNDYGDARSGGRVHLGIDIFAPTGTPVAAVKSGTLSLESGGAGGNAAYVHASDGNSYFYAHFSGYNGGGRQVSQGEVIGYVGQTGNASAPHLHFEIRTPGGSVNPYPTLAASC
jgi:murein DD-endopeptidase MepM/ murein hydrolase activator NlpD